MRSYLLLRNNVQSGPYSLVQLKGQGITPADLVWVEGESHAWEHPTEIRGLKTAARAGAQKFKVQPKSELPTPKKAYENSLPRATATKLEHDNSEAATIPYFPENIREYANGEKQPGRRSLSINPNFFGLAVLLIGVMLGAFVVKKMVDSFDEDASVATAQANQLQEETLLPSATSHNASTSVIDTENQTLVTTQPLTDTAKKIAVAKTPLPNKKTGNAANKNLKDSVNRLPQTDVAAITDKNDEVHVKQTEKEEVNETPPQLQLVANDYKVGLFGGISNLELSITNPSNKQIEKALVEVEFLKPNGSALKTQTLQVENISPGGEKKLAVPSSNRGVKVRYRIVSVQAKEGKLTLNDL